jgi:hypothetical protein
MNRPADPAESTSNKSVLAIYTLFTLKRTRKQYLFCRE